MKRKLLFALALAAVFSTVFVALKAARAPEEIEVKGTVWDFQGRRIDSVRIEAHRNGQRIRFTTSGSQGEYLMNVSGEEPFDLTFTRSGFDTSLLFNLSGKDDQVIGEVMFRPGEGNAQTRLTAEFARQYMIQMNRNKNFQ